MHANIVNQLIKVIWKLFGNIYNSMQKILIARYLRVFTVVNNISARLNEVLLRNISALL